MEKVEVLRLTNASENGPDQVRRALESIRGVSSVAFAPDDASVTVGFDEDLTSLQEVRTALRKAGIGVQRNLSLEEGMCCGSCGS